MRKEHKGFKSTKKPSKSFTSSLIAFSFSERSHVSVVSSPLDLMMKMEYVIDRMHRSGSTPDDFFLLNPEDGDYGLEGSVIVSGDVDPADHLRRDETRSASRSISHSGLSGSLPSSTRSKKTEVSSDSARMLHDERVALSYVTYRNMNEQNKADILKAIYFRLGKGQKICFERDDSQCPVGWPKQYRQEWEELARFCDKLSKSGKTKVVAELSHVATAKQRGVRVSPAQEPYSSVQNDEYKKAFLKGADVDISKLSTSSSSAARTAKATQKMAVASVVPFQKKPVPDAASRICTVNLEKEIERYKANDHKFTKDRYGKIRKSAKLWLSEKIIQNKLFEQYPDVAPLLYSKVTHMTRSVWNYADSAKKIPKDISFEHLNNIINELDREITILRAHEARYNVRENQKTLKLMLFETLRSELTNRAVIDGLRTTKGIEELTDALNAIYRLRRSEGVPLDTRSPIVFSILSSVKYDALLRKEVKKLKKTPKEEEKQKVWIAEKILQDRLVEKNPDSACQLYHEVTTIKPRADSVVPVVADHSLENIKKELAAAIQRMTRESTRGFFDHHFSGAPDKKTLKLVSFESLLAELNELNSLEYADYPDHFRAILQDHLNAIYALSRDTTGAALNKDTHLSFSLPARLPVKPEGVLAKESAKYIPNDDQLWNINCYEYLKNIAQNINTKNEKNLRLHSVQAVIEFNLHGDDYDAKYPYGDLYTRFLNALDKDIRQDPDNQNKLLEKLARLTFENPTRALKRTAEMIYDVVDQHMTHTREGSTRARVFGINDAVSMRLAPTRDYKRVNTITPRDEETFSAKVASRVLDFNPAHRTGMTTVKSYAYKNGGTWYPTERRMSTQAQDLDGKAVVSPIYERQLSATDKGDGSITEVYFNYLKRDSKQERNWSLALDELEKRHDNIAVVSLPANAGLMGKKHYKMHDNQTTCEDAFQRFFAIANGEDKKTQVDFHISPRVERLLYGATKQDALDVTAKSIQLKKLLACSFKKILGEEYPATSKREISHAELQAVFFHFIKYELTHFIIATLNPDTFNMTCKHGIDRGGISSAYYNLIQSMVAGEPLCKEEFYTALHAGAALVKGRGLNEHGMLLWNAVDCFIKNNAELSPVWLVDWRNAHTPPLTKHHFIKALTDLHAQITPASAADTAVRKLIAFLATGKPPVMGFTGVEQDALRADLKLKKLCDDMESAHIALSACIHASPLLPTNLIDELKRIEMTAPLVEQSIIQKLIYFLQTSQLPIEGVQKSERKVIEANSYLRSVCEKMESIHLDVHACLHAKKNVRACYIKELQDMLKQSDHVNSSALVLRGSKLLTAERVAITHLIDALERDAPTLTTQDRTALDGKKLQSICIRMKDEGISLSHFFEKTVDISPKPLQLSRVVT